jgi:V/A-type H+-transporting ATPase subunit E
MDTRNSLDNIIKEIENQAEETIKDIRESSKQEINKCKREFEDKKSRFLEGRKREFARNGEMKERELVTEEKLKWKKTILNKKRELIDRIIDQTARRLKQEDRKRYRRFLNNLLREIVDTQDEEIQPGREETVLTGDFVKEINREYNWNLTMGKKNSEIKDGFKLKGQDYETVVDWKAIREFIREKEEDRIARELFSVGSNGN